MSKYQQRPADRSTAAYITDHGLFIVKEGGSLRVCEIWNCEPNLHFRGTRGAVVAAGLAQWQQSCYEQMAGERERVLTNFGPIVNYAMFEAHFWAGARIKTCCLTCQHWDMPWEKRRTASAYRITNCGHIGVKRTVNWPTAACATCNAWFEHPQATKALKELEELEKRARGLKDEFSSHGL